ncbi:phosphoribosylglycinamide formyltransferase [Dolosicoccus paucivorans]|uniref:Phosphoribosylglycinamide formyltransferase n=1 Tax=Dolosicoccus paucivorans TaxID=84521 RepID=A0A1G8NUB1_9LACT|nr:phosphoribosylglycinamide formyltransferase [Dolosicoccus paucivorans]PMB84223.1 phosphoribosylglycinamide formyltransferase [Dolosicoccus paucivorans]PMC58686.1 phosphoribosylglycinamide formyltransferase [Dolosicoccus paucivorans]SDI83763.1 phosphoribosylglycinamide formyltransferase-1 [Dolosicoccus paucivorans]
MVKFGVLISGGGTNLQAVIDYCQTTPKAEVAVVISNNPSAYGLTRAKNHGIDQYVLQDGDDILNTLKEHDVDYVLLLGYLRKVPEKIIQAYPEKIINIHPSLIPAFSGKGYYGMKVHEAAIKKGVKYTGATVHFVNEIYDDGRIINQAVVPVDPKDTPETLQQKVLEVEHQLLIQSIKEVCQL